MLGRYVGLLHPQAQTLVRARDALCSGDVDFVYTRDGIGAFAWAYPDAVVRTARGSSPQTRLSSIGQTPFAVVAEVSSISGSWR